MSDNKEGPQQQILTITLSDFVRMGPAGLAKALREHHEAGLAKQDTAPQKLNPAAAWPWPTASAPAREPSMPSPVNNVAEKVKAAVSVSKPIREVMYTHVRALDDHNHVLPTGGVTVAFSPAPYGGKEPGDIYEIATAICSHQDVYCKAKGRSIAYTNFVNGKRIKVRVPKGMAPASFLQEMFFLQ